MKNKLLLVVVTVLIAGCSNKVEYATTLKDPITLDLVQQSISNSRYTEFGDYNPTDHFYNSCTWSWIQSHLRKISCDALDLRLKNQKINISSGSLVGYYMDQQAEERENSAEQRIKDNAAAKQLLIENMANGK